VQQNAHNATGGFQITLVNMGAPPEYAAVFAQAAAKWEGIITADVTDFAAADAPPDGWFAGYFKTGDYSGPVDDLVIGFRSVSAQRCQQCCSSMHIDLDSSSASQPL
jgi:hypothetical protein